MIEVRSVLRASIALCMLLLVPATAGAAVDVRRDAATGAITIQGTSEAAESVTVARDDLGGLRVSETTAVTSSDASCLPDALVPGAVTCVAPASDANLTVTLGDGADVLDARDALGTNVVVDGGPGTDTFRFAGSSSIRINDATATDVVDLSLAANAATRVRYELASARLVVRCTKCETPFVATLPVFPGTVLLGSAVDDVELTTWRRPGRTVWSLGEGDDRFFGSPIHRSVVAGGLGQDGFVSRAAVDTFIGGAGHDRFADFGGRGDVLNGGADIDVFASLDGQRDTILGGASPIDSCARPHDTVRCDSGIVRGVEATTYLPFTSVKYVLGYVGIK
ncbi:MAG: hypothetical protein JWM86_521 [Thermoleophilia bacterium]|nr:hypothetical protein [Thermoleophilia bacterium]